MKDNKTFKLEIDSKELGLIAAMLKVYPEVLKEMGTLEEILILTGPLLSLTRKLDASAKDEENKNA